MVIITYIYFKIKNCITLYAVIYFLVTCLICFTINNNDTTNCYVNRHINKRLITHGLRYFWYTLCYGHAKHSILFIEHATDVSKLSVTQKCLIFYLTK